MKARKNLKGVDPSTVIQQARGSVETTKKGRQIYINDDLTKVRSEIAARARQMKREKKIEDTWCRDGYIYVKTGEDGSMTRRLTTMRELLVLGNSFGS